MHLTRGQYSISTDPQRLDIDAIHVFLSRSFWAQGIPKELVKKSIVNSLSFGLFDGSSQVGFARVVTDRATFAYLCDVYILESHRGRGLGKWLIEAVMAHPDLQNLRRFQLVTRDAHGLYAQHGFVAPADPEWQMEIVRPGMYLEKDSMMAVKMIPDGYHTVQPYLMVKGAKRLLDFVKKVFDATEIENMSGPDGTVMHAEVRIGDSTVMIADAQGPWQPTTAALYVYVRDVDATYKRALAAGGTSSMEPADQFYGDRQGGVTDEFGNFWWIATHIEDVPKEEMARRAQEYMAKKK